MQAIFETLFDIVYLTTVITLGIKMIKNHNGQKQYLLFGIMAVTLGCGDAFHLVPRAVALCTTGLADYTTALGIGKMITSVTMTVFYVLLFIERLSFLIYFFLKPFSHYLIRFHNNRKCFRINFTYHLLNRIHLLIIACTHYDIF